MNQTYGYGELNDEKVARIKMLMAAIFELAMHDLRTGGFNDLNGAISWFTSEHTEEYPMSFQHVSSTLEFSHSRMLQIKEALEIGEQRKKLLLPLAAIERKARGLHVLCPMYDKRNGDGAYVRRVKRRTQ